MGQIKGQESRGQSPQLSFKVSLPGEGWRQISMSDEGSVQVSMSVFISGVKSQRSSFLREELVSSV